MSGAAAAADTTTVLLVVGMQNDKYRPTSLRASDSACDHITFVPHLLAQVNHCIRTARSRGWSVIFALDLHHPQHVSFQKSGGCNSRPPHCVLQSWGSNIVTGLEFGFDGSDMVVRGLDKDQDSDDAFYVSNDGTSPLPVLSRLKRLLRSVTTNERKRLAICGASPDGCIEQTALTASSKGYCRGDPIIISDCSALLTTTPDSLVLKPFSELLSLWQKEPSPILEG